MAPELQNGVYYNYKADFWSIGTILYQLLTGFFPFSATGMAELKFK